MDSSPSFEEDIASVSGEFGALSRAWHARGLERLQFGAYTVFGIVFFGIALFTGLGVLVGFMEGGPSSMLGNAILFFYVFLNAAIGYGFIFYRKWLVTAFSGIFILKTFLAVASLASPQGPELPASLFVVTAILIFILLTRSLLSGTYAAPKAIIPFFSVLLSSFLLANFVMVN